jgi:hypothetical protein
MSDDEKTEALLKAFCIHAFNLLCSDFGPKYLLFSQRSKLAEQMTALVQFEIGYNPPFSDAPKKEES